MFIRDYFLLEFPTNDVIIILNFYSVLIENIHIMHQYLEQNNFFSLVF